MATLQIISRPETEMTDGNLCRFSFGFNSVYWDIAKRQHLITGSTLGDGGFCKLFLYSTIDLGINQRLWIRAIDINNNVIKEGWFTVIDSNMTTAPYYVVINTPVTAPANLIVSGFANKPLTQNEKIKVSGFFTVGDSDELFTERMFSYANNGIARCYINGAARDKFAQTYDIDYEVTNHIVEGASLNYELDFTDAQDEELTLSVLSSSNYFIVNSVAQLGSDNRMIEYEVYNYGEITSNAKWLTAFERPVLFRGYPFGLCALIGRNNSNIKHRIGTGADFATHADYIMTTTAMAVKHFTCEVASNIMAFKTALILQQKEQSVKLKIDEDGSHLKITESGEVLNIN